METSGLERENSKKEKEKNLQGRKEDVPCEKLDEGINFESTESLSPGPFSVILQWCTCSDSSGLCVHVRRKAGERLSELKSAFTCQSYLR